MTQISYSDIAMKQLDKGRRDEEGERSVPYMGIGGLGNHQCRIEYWSNTCIDKLADTSSKNSCKCVWKLRPVAMKGTHGIILDSLSSNMIGVIIS